MQSSDASVHEAEAEEGERSGPGTPRYNAWTLEEFADLTTAWEAAINARPRNSDAMAVHNDTYRRFVALRGGSKRRNKPALTSKRSALKFSYMFVRDFNAAQKLKKEPPFFELSDARRVEVLKTWKQVNSSIVELSSDVYAALVRIMRVEPETDKATLAKERQQASLSPSPSVASSTSTTPAAVPSRVLGKRRQNAGLRASSNPWTGAEMLLLVKAWGLAAELVCESASTEPLSIIHEMYRQFEKLQGGKATRNLSGLATRRRVLRLSYSRVHAFDKIQEENGEPLYTELPLEARQSAMRSWKNANLVDLTAELLAALDKVMPLDTRALEMEDARRSKPGSSKRISNPISERSGSTAKAAKPAVQRTDSAPRASNVVADRAPKPSKMFVAIAPKPSNTATDSAPRAPKVVTDSAPTAPKAVDQGVSRVEPSKPVSEQAVPEQAGSAGKTSQATKEQKVQVDGPNGKTWSDEELDMLVKSWEKAAKLLSESPSVELMSLNREMYREFVKLQGGSTTRNNAALASRRSSLKFSYARIHAFNEAQKLKGEPEYRHLPEDARLSVMRSWKNRNSMDLSNEMYDALTRIMALDAKAVEAQSVRRSKAAHDQRDSKTTAEPSHAAKSAKWTTEESADLIKACADVMNVPADEDQTPTERESLIYDCFVARRQSAGDTGASLWRDLKSMAQQWRYILASYTYIKACNDKSAEMDSASWFEMPTAQKRAYQQCTNVPLKFVDLDAEMFALVTETSFDGVSSAPLPSPVAKTAAEGVTLRPRQTRQQAQDSSSSSESDSPAPARSKSKMNLNGDGSGLAFVTQKGNNWPAQELWNLIRAWEEAVAASDTGTLISALEPTFERFSELQKGPSNRDRNIHSVRNKMISLKSAYTGIAKFIKEQGDDGNSWFDMTSDERLDEIKTWQNKTIMDLNRDLYEALGRVLKRELSAPNVTRARRRAGRPSKVTSGVIAKQQPEEKRRAGTSKGEKQTANPVSDWSKDELLKLAEACGELLEGRRSRRYLFEEEKDRFYRRYKGLHGNNSLNAAVSRARYLMDSYEFIYSYNQKAAEGDSLLWFELPAPDRATMALKVSKAHHNFSGLGAVDAELFAVVDRIDAELRQKLGETKKKTYKPPTDAAGNARYGDPEIVVESCVFREKKQRPAAVKPSGSHKRKEVPVELPMYSSTIESSSSDDSASDYLRSPAMPPASAPVAPSTVEAPRPFHGRTGAYSTAAPRTQASRKRTRDDESTAGSSTLLITQIIQQQTRKLEQAVKRFRKDSSEARKEHHEFLLRKIQDTFPIDNGNGSYLERVVDRQGQSLVEIFQRLQQQRDVEKAKDQELRQLLGRSG
ncbi:hypothetical protein BBJ28_00012174 [Nothophytophthora sp. Chile5]|nr:hypothetical protein BBJ28_00012174 [Nothophytophthora sp. Chile5]